MRLFSTVPRRIAVSAGFLIGVAGPLHAQPSGPQPDRIVGAAERNAVISGVLDSLQRSYFSRSIAKQVSKTIHARDKIHVYDSVSSANTLARMLSEDLQSAAHDPHLRVIYSAEPIPPKPGPRPTPSPQQLAAAKAFHAKRNFGLVQLSRLPGNVGYMDLRAFADTSLAAETLATAMTFLSSTDALIIDLRNNRGGEPEMQALLASYFYPTRTLLSTFRSDDPRRVSENWTVGVKGPRYLDKPVYILTSARVTFSAAEGFSYVMQAFGKAKIVGEKTGGGTNPSDGYIINTNFAVLIPYATPVVAATNTNWASGVKPDSEVPAERALPAAHLMALEQLLSGPPSDLGAERRNAAAELREQLAHPTAH